MKCADPVLCYIDSKGNRKFRNFSFARRAIGGIPLDHIVFDCGKCLHCRKKKAYELACRCVLHASLYPDNCFLTLTYDEKKKGYHNDFEYSDIQKFKKRLRRSLKKKIEIFNVHEYGKNGKKHWHLVVFNWYPSDPVLFTTKNDIPLFTSQALSRLWPWGHSTIGDVSAASAMYTAQYMEKDFKNHNVANEKKSHSKHSGIGKPYFYVHYKQLLTLGYVPINGKKLPLPRYFIKLAHKHYCYFYEPTKFVDSSTRRKLYTPFRDQEPNREIADLYRFFVSVRERKLEDLRVEWNETVQQFLTTQQDPDFIKSNNNALYDLRNKNAQEKF